MNAARAEMWKICHDILKQEFLIEALQGLNADEEAIMRLKTSLNEARENAEKIPGFSEVMLEARRFKRAEERRDKILKTMEIGKMESCLIGLLTKPPQIDINDSRSMYALASELAWALENIPDDIRTSILSVLFSMLSLAKAELAVIELPPLPSLLFS